MFNDYKFKSVDYTHNNKWDFLVVRASINLSVRFAKSSIYYYEYY